MEADKSSTQYNRPAQALPYLSVLPMTEQYLDLSTLNRVQNDLAEQLVEKLLSAERSVTIPIPLAIQEDPSTEQISQFKALQKSFKGFQHQTQGLSIGFPILLIEDKNLGKPVSAPLFIWKVTLTPIAGNPMNWAICPLNGNRGYLNPLIKNYLEARFKFRWEQAIRLIDTVDKTNLEQTLEQLVKLEIINNASSSTIISCPLLERAALNRCNYSIILGQFEPITIKETKQLPKNLQTKHQHVWSNRLPALPTNHQQQAWLETVFDGHNTVVNGAFKTGKTHVIAAALPSVLVDKGSVLIVSPQPSTFNDLYHHLETMGLLDVGILSLQDEVLDKEKLITCLEQLPKKTRRISDFDEVKYSQELDSYKVLQERLIQAHKNVHQPLLNNWNWVELLGKSLLEHGQQHRQLIASFLDTEQFEFKEQEYVILKNDLQKHQPLFEALGMLKHPLNALDGHFFIENLTLDKAQLKVQQLIHNYRQKVQQLYDAHLIFVGEYIEVLQLRYHDFAMSIEAHLSKIERKIQLYKRLYGEIFDKQSGFQGAKLKVLSVFSKKHQAIRAAKKELFYHYQQLKDAYNQEEFLSSPFPNIKENTQLADISNNLTQIRQTLHQWQAKIPLTIKDARQNLRIDSSFSDKFKEPLNSLKSSFQELITQINVDKLLSRPVECTTTLLVEQEEFLLNLSLQLQKLEHFYKDFTAYYQWRYSWRTLDKRSQKIIQALVKINTKDWLTSFKSWYFHQVLFNHYSTWLPIENNQAALPFEALQKQLKSLQQQLYQKAIPVTKTRQRDQIKRIKREKDLTLTKARNIFKNKKIKDVLEWIGLEHLGQVFPIVLATPEMAIQLVGSNITAFDWVILENAHNLPQQLGSQLLQLGNQQIVFGQKEDSPRLKENALAWVTQQKGRQQQHFTKVHSKDSTPMARLEGASIYSKNSFHELLEKSLSSSISVERLQFQASVEGVIIDVLIPPNSKDQGKGLAIIIDGGLLYQERYDFQLAVQRQKIIQQQGYSVYYLWTVNWWKDKKQALEMLVTRISEFDGNKK